MGRKLRVHALSDSEDENMHAEAYTLQNARSSSHDDDDESAYPKALYRDGRLASRGVLDGVHDTGEKGLRIGRRLWSRESPAANKARQASVFGKRTRACGAGLQMQVQVGPFCFC